MNNYGFERGWVDAERGLTIKQNPYSKECVEWLCWRNGWRAFFEAFGC